MFHRYETVRIEGLHNMFTKAAQERTGLSSSDYAWVMENYVPLRQAYLTQKANAGLAILKGVNI